MKMRRKGTACYNCKGFGKAYSYSKGTITCPCCNGTGRKKRLKK